MVTTKQEPDENLEDNVETAQLDDVEIPESEHGTTTETISTDGMGDGVGRNLKMTIG